MPHMVVHFQEKIKIEKTDRISLMNGVFCIDNLDGFAFDRSNFEPHGKKPAADFSNQGDYAGNAH